MSSTDKEPILDEIITGMKEALAASTQGIWTKGSTTHDTVCNSDSLTSYPIATFKHSDDAQFCDIAHNHLPAVLKELERLKLDNVALQSKNDPAVAAMDFALKTEDGLTFLRLWYTGCFPEIRKEWPDCPIECFIGADPMLNMEG